ncbi:hypothetical protein ACFYVR_09280 [Rhodococcus sp. NPDC003318]|uniref:hypothetical protein n=1 Tax=Rhodococcus sp. NPDC003318 TaxID=3364503 RepID=UPI0036C64F11
MQRLQNAHAAHAMLPATPSDIAVTILPATAALPAVAIDPATAVLATVAAELATPALATVAAEPATAVLATVAAEPATAELATLATDPATAVLEVPVSQSAGLPSLPRDVTMAFILSSWHNRNFAPPTPRSSAHHRGEGPTATTAGGLSASRSGGGQRGRVGLW